MFLVGSFFTDMLPIAILDSSKMVTNITTNTTTVGATIDTLGYARILIVAAT